jgi:hypothetical protein
MTSKYFLIFIFTLFFNFIFSQDIIKETINGEEVSFEKHSETVKNIDQVIFIKKNNVIYKRIFDGSANVRWFGAKGDGKTDDTNAIQKVINSCYPIKFNKGVFLISALKLPYEFAGLSIEGSGFNHWHNNEGTVLKAISSSPIISPVNGCDWVKISNLRLEGANVSSIGINGVFGGGMIIDNVGIYNFKEYGIFSKQGLLRISDSFIGQNKIGVHLFSDSTISNTEITGGEICLYLLGGGNRGSNLWLNSSSKNLLVLKPDQNTGHQNTSLNNIYLGEVINQSSSDADQILIQGNATKRVQQVQITNSFYVHATNTKGSNSIFNIQNADEIIISNSNVLGQHTYNKANVFTNNFIKSNNSNHIKIVNNIIKGINNSAILIGENSCDWSILGNDFIDCAGLKEESIIQLVDENGSRALISNNKFIDSRGNNKIFAIQSKHNSGYFFENNQIVYPNSAISKDSTGNNVQSKNNYR